MLFVVLPAALVERDCCPILQMGRLRSRDANLLVVGFKSGTSDSRAVAFEHYARTDWAGVHPGSELGPCSPAVAVYVSGVRAPGSSILREIRGRPV